MTKDDVQWSQLFTCTIHYRKMAWVKLQCTHIPHPKSYNTGLSALICEGYITPGHISP